MLSPNFCPYVIVCFVRRVVIVFSVFVKTQATEEIVNGPDVVMRLRDKLSTDNLLDFDVISLETVGKLLFNDINSSEDGANKKEKRFTNVNF